MEVDLPLESKLESRISHSLIHMGFIGLVTWSGVKGLRKKGLERLKECLRVTLRKNLESVASTILEQAFNAKVPIKLPSLPPYRPGLDRTKHCRYHHNHGHNIEDYWALKDKIEELIQAGCLAIFVKEPGQRMT
ncbi:hypothetical protein JHK87_027651 [Glycine soja]|nr:hypothetical protein JHK87_027651 [Glycine soja]